MAADETPPPFVFVLPLISKTIAADWNEVSRLLERSLETCLAQQAENVHIVIALHEEPEFLTALRAKHANIHLVPAPLGPPHDRFSKHALRLDKLLKQKAAAVYCGTIFSLPLHMMQLDADDLVRNDLVNVVRSIAPTSSVLFQAGYIMYNSMTKIIEVPSAYSEETFDQACGSSAVIFCRQEDLPENVTETLPGSGTNAPKRLYNNHRGHKRWMQMHSSANAPIVVTTEKLVIYVRGHASNITRLKRDGGGFRRPAKGSPNAEKESRALPMERLIADRVIERFNLPAEEN